MAYYRKRKLHPVELSTDEKTEIKLYAAKLGYEMGYKEIDGVVYPTIGKDERIGMIQRYKDGLKAVYQQKKMDLDLAMAIDKEIDGMVKPGTRMYSFLAGLIDFEYKNW